MWCYEVNKSEADEVIVKVGVSTTDQPAMNKWFVNIKSCKTSTCDSI